MSAVVMSRRGRVEKRMRAVWYERTGPVDAVLTVGEQPTPQASPRQVRVRLAASGVNPAD
jgi:NADPH2:quinone reductase